MELIEKEKIKAEIERLYAKTSIGLNEYTMGYENGKAEVCRLLLGFINSLQKEPVSDDLREAANGYAFDLDEGDLNTNRDTFIAGANWQKEQMMKDAKYVEVFDDWRYGKDADFTARPAIKLRDSSLEIGKQVKLIIIKED